MALIGNYSVILKNPGRYFGGSTVSDNRANYNNSGSARNIYLGASGTIHNTVSVPNGYRPPYCWILPNKDGGMSTYTTIQGSGGVSFCNLAGGLGASGTLTGSGYISDAGCGLTVPLQSNIFGSGIMNNTIFGAASGTAAIACVSWASGVPGALGNIISPITGNCSISGSIYALGNIVGEVTPFTELSPQSLADAVWSTISIDFDEPGTMGEKLNDAGAAGDPWNTAVPSTYPSGTAGHIMGQVQAMATGRIVESSPGVFDFYAPDNTTILFTLTKSGSERTRS